MWFFLTSSAPLKPLHFTFLLPPCLLLFLSPHHLSLCPLLQAWCTRSSTTSQGHPVHGRAEPRGDQGEHRGQELCSHCSGCGPHHAWRSAAAPFTAHSYFILSDLQNNVTFLHVSALMCIVKPDGPPQLCKTDEIGEIVINSRAGGTMYYNLPGVTKNTFEVGQKFKTHDQELRPCMTFSTSVLDTIHHISSKTLEYKIITL